MCPKKRVAVVVDSSASLPATGDGPLPSQVVPMQNSRRRRRVRRRARRVARGVLPRPAGGQRAADHRLPVAIRLRGGLQGRRPRGRDGAGPDRLATVQLHFRLRQHGGRGVPRGESGRSRRGRGHRERRGRRGSRRDGGVPRRRRRPRHGRRCRVDRLGGPARVPGRLSGHALLRLEERPHPRDRVRGQRTPQAEAGLRDAPRRDRERRPAPQRGSRPARADRPRGYARGRRLPCTPLSYTPTPSLWPRISGGP